MSSERLTIMEEALSEISGLAYLIADLAEDPGVARIARDIYKTAHLALTEEGGQPNVCLDCA